MNRRQILGLMALLPVAAAAVPEAASDAPVTVRAERGGLAFEAANGRGPVTKLRALLDEGDDRAFTWRLLLAAAAAEKNAKGELDVKVGLGYYSTGDYEQAVAAARRGIAKGGVARIDDANLLLGAALVELGRRDEARAAFEAARAAAPAGSLMTNIAGLWLARLTREGPAPAAG